MKASNCLTPLLTGAWLVGLALLAGAPQGALAQDQAACCMRGTSTAYSFINQQGQEPDEKFFTVRGAPPNIMFLLDTSDSMYGLAYGTHLTYVNGNGPARDPALSRCNNPVIDAYLTANGWDPAGNYPPPDLGVAGVAAPLSDPGFPQHFNQSMYYVDNDPFGPGIHYGWGEMWADARLLTNPIVTSDPGGPSTWHTFAPAAKRGACDRTSNPAECIACVNSKGYYLDPANWPGSKAIGAPPSDVFSGRFLNFYPPKYIQARTVLKQMAMNIRNARVGLSHFNSSNGATLRVPFAPACDKMMDPNDPEWQRNRERILFTLNADPFWNPPSYPYGIRYGPWFLGNTPLAESLLDVGQYFTANQSIWEGWFGTGWYDTEFRNDFTQNNRSICYGCQLNAVLVLTDGEPYADNCVPQCVKNQDPPCPYADCDDSIYGWTCSNGTHWQYPSKGSCPARCGTGSDCKAAGGSSCCSTAAAQQKHYFDAVTKWFYEKDLVPNEPPAGSGWTAEGQQRLNTYVVAIGIDHPVLRNASDVSGGQYFTTTNRQTLEEAVNRVVADVVTRATSFGVSSVSTLQTQAGLATVVPRFSPGKEGEQWKGYLYRFELASELVNGCTPSAPPAPPSSGDVNADGDCNDVFFLDRDGSIVEENSETGLFVKKGTTTPAKPVWEAGRELTYQSPTYNEPETAPLRNPDLRNIWTVVDSNDDGKLDDTDDMVEFTAANAAQLMPYMNIGTDVTNDTVCSDLHARLGLDPATTPLSTWGLECTRAIIQHYRGKRSLDPDPAVRNDTRPWLLGDIFHSSPVIVEPPISEGACGFFRNQCLSSIYTYGGRTDQQAREAYRDYVAVPDKGCSGAQPCERRPALVLVGSNGGFLHAFDSGRPEARAGKERDDITQRLFYNLGTGREVWAFVPPDLLGTMKHKLEGHSYFVDGTAMVRDIWVDSTTNPNQKDAGEFRTVAIVGERSGGQHFFALDVTRTVDEGTPPRPRFRWLWPQPCDPLAAQVGQSWSTFNPKPPPIVPVLFEDPAGFEFQFRRYNGSTWDMATARARERWVALLNGGNDRALVRGRGFAMVDAWTGRTYWSEFFDSSASAKPMNRRLEYPFVAGAALLDIGPGETGNREFFDGYFDTATLGDMGGNLWVLRFYEPGQISPVTNQVTNWGFARAFRQYESEGNDMRKRRPISYIAANALQPSTSYLRTFFGSGDQASLTTSSAGQCTLDSVYTCAAMGCEVDAIYTFTNAPSGGAQIKARWSGGQLVQNKIESIPCVNDAAYAPLEAQCMNLCTTTACGLPLTHAGLDDCLDAVRALAAVPCTNACAESQVTAYVKIDQCPASVVVTPRKMERRVKMRCTTGGGGNLLCTADAPKNDVDKNVNYQAAPNPAPPEHRYYGVHAFGGGSPPRIFNNPVDAEAFDSQRLSDSNVCPSSGVPPAGCLVSLGSLSTPSSQSAGANNSGWFISYDTADERTASSAGLTFSQNLESGCVVWNSLKPLSSSSNCGQASSSQQARIIQADYITGASNCVAGFGDPAQRFLQSTTIAPLPEPTAVTMIPPSGTRVSYGLFIDAPGTGGPRTIVTANDFDMVQSVYQLELSPHEHMCRHQQGGDVCAR